MSFFQTLRFIRSHPLASRRHVAAMARYVRWQVESRLRDEVTFDWVGGSKLVARHGMTGATGNIYCGLHEFVDMAFLLHVLRPDDLFVDVGANIGSYTVLASGVCGARSIAVEPDPGTIKALRRNVEANGIGERVRIVEAALGATPGVARFTVGQDTMNHVADDADLNVREVYLRTLDDVIGDDRPTLLKMDVEGFEPQVIAGAMGTIAKSSLGAVITETADEQVCDALVHAGFVHATYDPYSRTLATGARLSALGSANTLFVRGDWVAERLKSAPLVRAAGVSF